jgi:hypothetical protein
MAKDKLALIWMFTAILLAACSSTQDEEKSGCLPPQKGFAEADLIGTWFNESGGYTDKLILREDGKYKQIIHIEVGNIDYESDWQDWWIEYAGSDIHYLRLAGLRACAYVRGMDCIPVEEVKAFWYDFCQDKAIFMSEAGVLMVLRVPERFEQPPHGIELVFPLAYEEDTWRYELQEVIVPTDQVTPSVAPEYGDSIKNLIYLVGKGFVLLILGLALLIRLKRR